MKTTRRLLRKKVPTKITAVVLSVLLLLPMTGLYAFAESANTGKAAESAALVEDTQTEATTPTVEETPVPEGATPVPEKVTPTPETPEVTTPTPAEAPEAPAAEEPVVEPVSTVRVDVDLTEAYITYKGNNVYAPADGSPAVIEATAGQELAFSASANEGFELDAVKAINGASETLLQVDANGTYKVAANLVADGLKIAVTTKAIPAADEPAQTPTDPAAQIVQNKEMELYATVGNVIVKITAAAGVLPEGAQVVASQVNDSAVENAVAETVEAQGKVLEDAVAIDVTLVDKDGNKIQPNGQVNVCFFDANLAGGEIGVYRVSDDASNVETIGTRQADSKVQSFDVNHFSIYVVSGQNPYYTDTYSFYDGETLLGTQTVKTGDTLLEPETPTAPSGKFFQGWYTAAEGGNRFDSFGTQGEISANTAVSLYARYADAYYVYFMDNSETPIVIATKQGAEGGTITTDDVSFPINADESITGWSTTKSGTPVATPITLEKSDITLYPIVSKGHWLTFDSNGGGSYTNPVFYAANAPTATPAAPTRAGYTFGGWYTNASCTNAFSFGSTLGNNTVLYAKWTANTNTSYTLVYWIENADDTFYTFEKTVTATGTTNKGITLSSQQTSTNQLNYSYRNYFTYNSQMTNEGLRGTTIAGDGSTVVNIYFSRNTYTLTFKVNNSVVTTIKAKYNAEISAKFGEAPFTTTYKGRAWEDTGNVYSYALQTLDRMPGRDVTFKLYDQSSRRLKTIYYYVQTVDSTATPTSWPSGAGTDYELLKSVDTYFNYATYDEEYHPIQGFERFSANKAGFDRDNQKSFVNNKLYLYYIRSSYTLSFQNVDNIDKTEQVKYEAPLADSYSGYTPNKPDTIPEGYVFGGWYTSPECEDGTEAATNLANMPAGNAIVYAKWTAPVYTATVYLSVNITGGDTKTYSIPYGEKLDENTLNSLITVPAGKTLRGWYYVENNARAGLYNFDTRIYSDITLAPYWTDAYASYTVSYDANGGTGTVPTDAQSYADGSYAKVLEANGIVAPSNKAFIGWNTEVDGSGAMYQPGNQIEISGNVTLCAQWGDTPTKTSLTYTANGGVGDDVLVENKDNNTKLTALDNQFTRDDYYFTGWNTAADGTGTAVAAGDTILIDVLGASGNILYAQWEAKTSITITAASQTWAYDGSTHSNNTVTLADGSSLKSGDTLEASATGSVKNVLDTVANNNPVAVGYKVTRNGTDVSYEYKITPQAGTLTINAIEATFTGESAAKTYTGVEQGLTGITPTGLLAGHTYEGLSYSAKGKNVGEYDGAFTGTVVIKDAEGNDVTGNYAVTQTPGKLTINRAGSLTVQAAGNTKTETYDGTLKTVEGWSPAAGTPADVTITLAEGKEAKAEGTDANTYQMGLTSADFSATSPNYETVNVEYTDGWLLINRADSLTVQAAGNTKTETYDGTLKTVEGWSPAAGTPADVTITLAEGKEAKAEGTDANTYQMGLTSADFSATSPNYETVNVEYTDGWLTIGALADEVVVTVTENSATETFDGTEKSVTGYTATSISNPLYTEADFTFSGTAEAKGTERGFYPMSVTSGDFANDSKNFSNVTFKVIDGGLTIVNNDLPVEKTTDSATYAVGDTVNYTINITNTSGFATDGDVTVTDPMFASANAGSMNVTGASYTLVGDTMTIAGPVADQTAITITYSVTAATAGSIVNTATVSGNVRGIAVGGNGSSTVVVDTPTIAVVKALTNAPADGVAFTVGETATFGITVTNTSTATTYANVAVQDVLAGAFLTTGTGYSVAGGVATIPSLAPGESVIVNAGYIITTADLGTTLNNTATATVPDGGPTGTDTITVPTGPVVPVGPGIIPAAVVPAVVAAAPAAIATIVDDPVPTTIVDDPTPLANFEGVFCWVHWVMLAFMILTALYSMASILKRRKEIEDAKLHADEEEETAPRTTLRGQGA